MVSLIQASFSIVLLYYTFFKPCDHDPKFDINEIMVGNYDILTDKEKFHASTESSYDLKSLIRGESKNMLDNVTF